MNKDWLDIDVLEDYLDGKLDGKAMHFVEKQALDDPFIAEALEGLRQSPKRKQNFSILQKRLHDRVALQPVKRKLWGITTHRLSIAATATVVFIAVSILFFMRENNRKTAETAQRRAKGVVVNIDSNTALAITKTEDKGKSLSVAPEKSDVIEQAILNAKKDGLAINDKKASAKAINGLTKLPSAAEEVSAKQGEAYAAVQNAQQIVKAKADGYLDRSMDSMQRNADLAKNNAVNEVTTLKAASARKKETESVVFLNAKATKPLPTANYDEYLRLNNKLLNKNNLNGTVSLSFMINKDGRPENISVIKSLTKEADAEAIRLIKEGPNWLLPVSGVNIATLEVKF